MKTNLKTVARLKRVYTRQTMAGYGKGTRLLHLKVGVQSFMINGYYDTKAEANWMADRLAEALAKLIELEG